MNLELTKEELHDLYDMLYILDSGDMEVNGLMKSWQSIFNKIEPIVVPELRQGERNNDK
jgi:hypothetical protein